MLPTCSYRGCPGQPIPECRVTVVEPELVLGARQSSGELDHMAQFPGWNGCIWRRMSMRRTVVQTVGTVVLAQILRYLYHQFRCLAYLQVKTEISRISFEGIITSQNPYFKKFTLFSANPINMRSFSFFFLVLIYILSWLLVSSLLF